MGHIDLIGALKGAWQLFLRDPLRLILLVLLGSVISMTIILAPFMVAGCFEVLGKLSRRETPEPEDLFRPLREFERYLVGGLIWLGAQLLGIVVGMTVPFLGTMIALVVNAFLLCYFPLMVFRRMDGTAAFGACRDLFRGEWPLLLVTAAILSVLSWVGAVTIFIGFLVITPFALALILCVYEQIYGLDDTGTVVEAETD